jgi:hypothetical protein
MDRQEATSEGAAMFVQVIQGKVNDAEGFARQIDRWTEELQPGAKGFLGSTGGVAADGTAFAIVRFESEADAEANAARPEQGAWFNEVAKYYEGEPTFRNSSDAVEFLGGGSDDAGFVQVMIYEVTDRPGLEKLDAQFMDQLPKVRPDLLGAIRVWDGNTAVDVNYFTSEAEARENEKKMDEQMKADMEQFGAVMGGEPTFIDLPDPVLRSA